MSDELRAYLEARMADLLRQQAALAPAVIQATQTIAQYNQIAAALDEIRAIVQQDTGAD